MAFDQSIALVTGTSSGIGAALAESLLLNDWSVIGLARRGAPIRSSHYHHLEVDLGDLASLKDVAANQLQPMIADTPWRRVGLVNNAAMIGALDGIEACDPEQLARIFAVNTVAPAFLMGMMSRIVEPTTCLRIVNVSSGAAGTAYPGLGAYGGSKAALRLAGMALAAELESDERAGGPRPNAAILSYEPGVVDTAMQEETRSTSAAEFPWSQPFRDFASEGILAKPQEVIGEIVDFLSGDSEESFAEKRYGAD
ncbi:MAG: SDR family NAD(P)-dependent oxidoreductase [Gammaproteobacteria bacterium]